MTRDSIKVLIHLKGLPDKKVILNRPGYVSNTAPQIFGGDDAIDRFNAALNTLYKEGNLKELTDKIIIYEA